MAAGRNRAFDTDKALEAAMMVFWQNGYVGTSLTDLTAAMGINKPSMYSAFGNKEALFELCLRRYLDLHGAPYWHELGNQTQPLDLRVAQFLGVLADLHCDSEQPGGCFIASGTNECKSEGMPVSARNALAEINQENREAMTALFAAEAELPSHYNGQSAADFLSTIVTGLSVMARNGIDRGDLQPVIDTAASTFRSS